MLVRGLRKDGVTSRSLNLGHAARGTVVFPPRGAAGAGLLSVAPSFK